jgi:hypothetical protein
MCYFLNFSQHLKFISLHRKLTLGHSIFTFVGWAFYGFSLMGLSIAVVPIKFYFGLGKNWFVGIFMVITMFILAFFQLSGTYKNSKKWNVCLLMLFFPCYFWSVGPFCIWYMEYGISGIWYENGIHSVFTYVLHVSCSGCLQHTLHIFVVSLKFLK